MKIVIKQRDLNRWFWRWHIIAGLITLPIVLLLCVTGVIYLFKQDYNNWQYQSVINIAPRQGEMISYQQQLDRVKEISDQQVSQLYLSRTDNQAQAFRIREKGHARHIWYVNPYSGEITGQINQKQTLMYDIRKLHGELLLSTPGTLTVELVASWFVILCITGIYVFWPNRIFSLAGFFTIRLSKGSRIFWRDIHSVLGFWLAIIMLVIIAGAMPWTNVFGGGLKWLQKQTDSGFPNTWRSTAELVAPSQLGTTYAERKPLNLDEMVFIANQQNLPGKLTLTLPEKDKAIFTLANRSFWLEDQQVIHFDQYTGEIIKQHSFDDVGILMQLRLIFMRIHQGEYGLWNWWIVLIASVLFTLSTVGGLLSYLKRKPKGKWGLPKVPAQFKVGQVLLLIILILAVIFPMFGISLVIISLIAWLAKQRNKQSAKQRDIKIEQQTGIKSEG